MSARTPRVGGGRTNRTPRSGRTQTTKDSATKASLRTCDLTGNAWLERQTAKIEAKAKEVQDLYVGNQLIKPRWMKVSKTPWTSLKAASGGYGRRVYNSAISDEMPKFMHIDEVDAHDAHAPIKRRPPKPVKGKHVWKTRCSDDAPEFFLTDAAKALRDGHMTLPKHRGMPYGGPLCSGSDRLMLEPAARGRWTCPGASAARRLHSSAPRRGLVPTEVRAVTARNPVGETRIFVQQDDQEQHDQPEAVAEHLPRARRHEELRVLEDRPREAPLAARGEQHVPEQ